jgi:hypothetical protein
MGGVGERLGGGLGWKENVLFIEQLAAWTIGKLLHLTGTGAQVCTTLSNKYVTNLKE